jgi:hypothetical protein
MIPATNEGILELLQEEGKEAVLQKETNQVFYLLKTNNQEFAVFFRFYEGEELLQILTFFPMQLKKERYNTMARMLHYLNREIDLPGFGMDEKLGVVFHRIMIPIFNEGQLEKTSIKSYLDAIEKIAEHFFTILHGTAESTLSYEEILKKSQIQSGK